MFLGGENIAVKSSHIKQLLIADSDVSACVPEPFQDYGKVEHFWRQGFKFFSEERRQRLSQNEAVSRATVDFSVSSLSGQNEKLGLKCTQSNDEMIISSLKKDVLTKQENSVSMTT